MHEMKNDMLSEKNYTVKVGIGEGSHTYVQMHFYINQFFILFSRVFNECAITLFVCLFFTPHICKSYMQF